MKANSQKTNTWTPPTLSDIEYAIARLAENDYDDTYEDGRYIGNCERDSDIEVVRKFVHAHNTLSSKENCKLAFNSNSGIHHEKLLLTHPTIETNTTSDIISKFQTLLQYETLEKCAKEQTGIPLSELIGQYQLCEQAFFAACWKLAEYDDKSCYDAMEASDIWKELLVKQAEKNMEELNNAK